MLYFEMAYYRLSEVQVWKCIKLTLHSWEQHLKETYQEVIYQMTSELFLIYCKSLLSFGGMITKFCLYRCTYIEG